MLIERKFLELCLGCNLVPRALFPGSRLFRLAKQAIFLYVEKAGLSSPTYCRTKIDGCSTLYRFLTLSGWMRCVCGSITTHQAGFKLFKNKCIELGLLEGYYNSLIQILFVQNLSCTQVSRNEREGRLISLLQWNLSTRLVKPIG